MPEGTGAICRGAEGESGMAIQRVIMSRDVDSFDEPETRIFDKEEVTLGRLETNDLVLDRPEISSNHAKLRLVDNGTGTILENRELKPQAEIALRPHQRLVIGTYLIKPSVVNFEDALPADEVHLP